MASDNVSGKRARSSAYAEKLKDPRWQRKRLEIMERDAFACQMCDDAESPLHVHHKWYVWGNDPWDYPNDALVTLCLDCHEGVTNGKRGAEGKLLHAVRTNMLNPDNVECLAEALSSMLEAFGENEITGLLDTMRCEPQLLNTMIACGGQALVWSIPSIQEAAARRAIQNFARFRGVALADGEVATGASVVFASANGDPYKIAHEACKWVEGRADGN